jgi:ribosomal protein S18 acetylase RimI-like enzyme
MLIAIRPYQENDFDQVLRIWIGGWKSTGVVVARTEASLRGQLSEEVTNGHSIYVATTPSGMIGFVALYGSHLEQLFVAPAAQRRGVGKVLLDFAKTQNPGGLWLTMAADNKNAARFYEREGLRRGETSMHPRLGHQVVRYEWVPKAPEYD